MQCVLYSGQSVVCVVLVPAGDGSSSSSHRACGSSLPPHNPVHCCFLSSLVDWCCELDRKLGFDSLVPRPDLIV